MINTICIHIQIHHKNQSYIYGNFNHKIAKNAHDKCNVYTYKYIAKVKAIFILIIQAIIKWQSAECVLALNKDKLSGTVCVLITDCNNGCKI